MFVNKYTARVIVLSAIAFIPCSFATVTTGFSPGGTALNLILQFAGRTRQSMDVAAYDFTSQARDAGTVCLRSAGRCALLPMKEKPGTLLTCQYAGLRGRSAGPAFYLLH